MKKTITILMMLIGLMSFSQNRIFETINNATTQRSVESNITSILNETCDFSGGCHLRLGCCYDGTDHVNSGCDSEQGEPTLYYVTEDINYDRASLTIGNVILEFRNGANFYANGATIDECVGQIIFIGGGQVVSESLSLKEFSKTIEKGEIFIVYNSLGQMIKIGKFNDIKDLYSNELRFIRFPKLNYSAKMILKQ